MVMDLEFFDSLSTALFAGRCWKDDRFGRQVIQTLSSAAATSFTLVPVGPVTSSPSTAFRAW